MPIYANALYVRKLNRLLRKAKAAHADGEAQRKWLERHGGTSWVWIVVLVLAVLIVAAVSLPAYQDYIRSAEAAREQLSQAEAERSGRGRWVRVGHAGPRRAVLGTVGPQLGWAGPGWATRAPWATLLNWTSVFPKPENVDDRRTRRLSDSR